MNIAIIIPTHNRKKELCTLLQMLKVEQRTSQAILEVVCVVAGSNDGTLEVLKSDFPEVKMVIGDKDWWYTKCINEGLNYAKTQIKPKFYLTLNDDVEIKPGFIDGLLNGYKEMGELGLLGAASVTIEKPTKITFSGLDRNTRFPWNILHKIEHLSEVKTEELNGVHSTYRMPGRCILISDKVLSELKGFDDRFPQYHSDADFSSRARKSGFKVCLTYNVLIYSHHKMTYSLSSAKFSISNLVKDFLYPYGRNHLLQKALFIWRHEPKLLFLFFYAKWFTGVVVSHLKSGEK